MATQQRIGFIGIGTMGRPMSTNLVKAGCDVIVFDVVPAATEPVVALGAKRGDSLAALAAGVDVVISMLPGPTNVRDTYLGDSGFLTVARSGTIVVDMSTVDPGTSRAVAAAGAARGVRVLDAPVSGSSAGAIEGTLTIMVGGDASTLQEVRSTLAVMGPNVIHVGDNGAGSALKLVNNLIAGISMGAVAEGFALGLKAGLDPHKMFEVISKSSGNCWNLQTRAPAAGVVPTSPASNGYAPGFMTDLMRKDLGLAVSAGNELHVTLPLCGLAQQWYAISSAMGHGREDFSVLGAVLQELAGLERA